MIPSSLIPDLRALRPDQSPEENLLNARLVCRLLADRVLEFQFVNAKDFAEFLRQVANAARKAGGALSEMKSEAAPAPIAASDVAGSRSLTDVSGESGREKDGTEPTE
jgi:hypothetical protein